MKHGMWRTPEFRAWQNAKDRCLNPHSAMYRHYGARGIIFAPEWELDFIAFFKHIGPRPSDQHSLDRINNDKGYEPGNVRWATSQEQMLNTRMSYGLLEAFGRNQSAHEWANEFGLKHTTLLERLRRGWDLERALTQPLRVRSM